MKVTKQVTDVSVGDRVVSEGFEGTVERVRQDWSLVQLTIDGETHNFVYVYELDIEGL